MTTETDVRPSEVKSRLRELNTALAEERKTIDAVTAAFKVEGKNVEVTTEQRDDLRKAVANGEELKSLISDLERANGIGDFLDQAAGTGTAGEDQASRQNDGGGRQAAWGRKSLGELVTDSDIRARLADGATSATLEVKGRNIGMMGYAFGGGLEQKDVYTAAGGSFTIPAFGSQQNDGLIIPAYRTLRIRDLFPVAGTTANLIEYVRRTGYVNNARTVAERTAADGSAATGGGTDVFGLKPPSNLTFTAQQAPVRVIAHTIDVSKTVLDDEPRLQDTINGEMLYGLRLTEDAEILFGDGTGSHLTGILNTAGIQAYAQSSGPSTDYKSDAVRRALTRIMLAYYDATGLVLHPFDWEDTELEKDSQNRYILTQNVAVGAQKQLWTVPVVATPAMTQGTFLAGAFGLGAKLYDRESATIAVSTETRDLFDRNAVAIRAEERVALEVGRPEAFVRGAFS
jgi:HK97 family phage major capsid protein